MTTKQIYRRMILAMALLFSASFSEAGLITFNAFDAAGGIVQDAANTDLIVTGYSQPVDVAVPSGGPYVHAHTLTVSEIDFDTGLAGGTGSFSFDITYTSLGSKLDFVSGGQVALSKSAPLTVTIGNFQIVSGSGAVSFEGWNNVLIRSVTDPAEVTIYEGADLLGADFGSVTEQTTVEFSSSNPSITIDLSESTANLGNVGFDLKVIPEPATIGLFGLASVVLLVLRRRMI